MLQQWLCCIMGGAAVGAVLQYGAVYNTLQSSALLSLR